MFEKYILKPFLSAATNHGNKSAFCINERFYSYFEFLQTISKIRDAIQKLKSVSKNVGLVANDDLETYASIYAIWMEGYAYVPLHPLLPEERNQEIISQSEIDLVLDSGVNTKIKNVAVIETTMLTFVTSNIIPKEISEDSLAYILFTSGSTGKPKGVMISRKNLGAFMRSFWQIGFQISNTDKCLQCFDLTFDVSVQSYLVPLTKGACTYTIPLS